MSRIFFLIFSLLYFHTAYAKPKFNLMEKTKLDHKNFYSAENLSQIGVGFLGGAGISHSNFDKKYQNFYQKNIRSGFTDELAKTTKLFGEKNLVIPLTLLAYNLPHFTEIDENSDFSVWVDNSLRSYMLTMPIMLTMQKVTGGSRPDEKSYDAKWKPFRDKNGVSGHAAGGAIPFLSAAIIYDKGSWQRNSLFFASTLTAWSRVNDDQHYLSQAFLGWYLSYKAVQSVSESNDSNSNFTKNKLYISPYVSDSALGLQLRINY